MPAAMYAGSSDVALSSRTLPADSATMISASARRTSAACALRTRGGSFFHVRRDVEVADVELVNLLHLRIVERLVRRRAHELLELLVVIDVRQRRQDCRMRVKPQQRELPHRYAALLNHCFQSGDFLQSFHHPGARPVRTMVALVELCV